MRIFYLTEYGRPANIWNFDNIENIRRTGDISWLVQYVSGRDIEESFESMQAADGFGDAFFNYLMRQENDE